jgi:hypothetical protein
MALAGFPVLIRRPSVVNMIINVRMILDNAFYQCQNTTIETPEASKPDTETSIPFQIKSKRQKRFHPCIFVLTLVTVRTRSQYAKITFVDCHDLTIRCLSFASWGKWGNGLGC